MVTNETKWDDWTLDDSDKDKVVITTPDKTGYTADKKEVADTLAPNTKDKTPVTGETTVTYTANEETANVDIVDNNGKKLATVPLSGKYGDKLDKSKLNDEINKLVSEGYDVVTPNDIPDTVNWDGSTPTFTIKASDKTETVTETTSTTETVHYQYADGSKAGDDKVVTLHYHRSGTEDMVTKDVQWDNWILDDADKGIKTTVPTPDKTGYTADKKEVADALAPNTKDKTPVTGEATVTYTANNESATVNYIDNDDDNKIVKSDTLSGKFNDKADYDIDSVIKELEAKGYDVTVNGYPKDGYKFGINKPTFIIILKHHHDDVIDHSGKGQVTVHYQQNGKMISPDVTKEVTFTRHNDVDKVTGKTIYGDWIADTNNTIVSPDIAGFTTNQKNVVINEGENDSVIVKYTSIDNNKASISVDPVIHIHKGNNWQATDSIHGLIDKNGNSISADEALKNGSLTDSLSKLPNNQQSAKYYRLAANGALVPVSLNDIHNIAGTYVCSYYFEGRVVQTIIYVDTKDSSDAIDSIGFVDGNGNSVGNGFTIAGKTGHLIDISGYVPAGWHLVGSKLFTLSESGGYAIEIAKDAPSNNDDNKPDNNHDDNGSNNTNGSDTNNGSINTNGSTKTKNGSNVNRIKQDNSENVRAGKSHFKAVLPQLGAQKNNVSLLSIIGSLLITLTSIFGIADIRKKHLQNKNR